MVERLVTAVHEISPDVVVVSGDLTQRARPVEFEEARLFLDRLPKPQIVIPGNHDVPLHNIYSRFWRGLDAYQKYISQDLEPFFSDREIAIVGVNTARRLTIKSGRINQAQIDRIEEQLCGLSNEIKKIVVTHHPFDLPAHYQKDSLVGRAAKAMARLARCKIDVLLAGHLHLSFSGPTAIRYNAAGHSAIFVQAGTACSTRSRGEPNSFNVILLEQDLITVQTFSAEQAEAFELRSTQGFCRSSNGWIASVMRPE